MIYERYGGTRGSDSADPEAEVQNDQITGSDDNLSLWKPHKNGRVI